MVLRYHNKRGGWIRHDISILFIAMSYLDLPLLRGFNHQRQIPLHIKDKPGADYVQVHQILSGNLADDLCFSRIRFNDLHNNADGEFDAEDIAGRFDADFALMSGTYGELINRVISAFGGIDESIE